MDENIIVWQATLAGLGLVAASSLYSFGGRSGKWKRRFIASFILACTVNGLALWNGLWQPLMLVVYPLLCIGFSMGYGDKAFGFTTTTNYHKILKRSIYAIGVCLSGVVMAFILGGNAWWVLIPHIGIGMFSVFLGTKNPISAAAEEFFICLILNAMLVAYPFITGV